MNNNNGFKIGLFGANCSSGRAVTMVRERWPAGWDDNLNLAKMADEAGVDFLLPVARWKGYGGDTDYQGSTFETITWARSEEHTSELQSHLNLVCRLLLEKKKND